jgi:hypothetical protein
MRKKKKVNKWGCGPYKKLQLLNYLFFIFLGGDLIHSIYINSGAKSMSMFNTLSWFKRYSHL